jgi:Barstar (barnase inhibitor)
MSEISAAMFDPTQSGVYAAPHSVDALRLAAAAHGVAWCDLDLAGVSANVEFLASCAAALQFPASFGRNWDALADCLEDLSWQPAQGIVVQWRRGGDFVRHAPEDCSAALEIFAAAATYWQHKSRLLLVLLDAPSRRGHMLHALPGG